ncbi:uncharacterized protein LOC144107936 [Amblyomma americanum]|uniref:C2H2-type domain-containing protein n=1 Tax=Amblyomma americanum TaxID=6943 RepID=A0AAQ4FCW1_AMBAM
MMRSERRLGRTHHNGADTAESRCLILTEIKKEPRSPSPEGNVVREVEGPGPTTLPDKQFTTTDEASCKSVSSINSRPVLACHLCPYTTKSRASLNTHVHSHTAKKQSQCSPSPSSFASSSDLVRHMMVHTGGEEFTCSVCYATFPTKQELGDHTVGHMGGGPYQCPVCLWSFTLKRFLMTHLRTHRPVQTPKHDTTPGKGE